MPEMLKSLLVMHGRRSLPSFLLQWDNFRYTCKASKVIGEKNLSPYKHLCSGMNVQLCRLINHFCEGMLVTGLASICSWVGVSVTEFEPWGSNGSPKLLCLATWLPAVLILRLEYTKTYDFISASTMTYSSDQISAAGHAGWKCRKMDIHSFLTAHWAWPSENTKWGRARHGYSLKDSRPSISLCCHCYSFSVFAASLLTPPELVPLGLGHWKDDRFYPIQQLSDFHSP